MAERIDWSLYLVTDSGLSRGRSLIEIVEAAIAGGVTVVQYREKGATTRRMVEEALGLRELCRRRGIPFIVNDRLDVALAVEADGIHVGQDDLPASLARRLIGRERILGVSAETPERAARAEAEGADYIGASPIFATPTKSDAPPPMGIAGLRLLSKAVAIPVVAIGGINRDNAASLIAAGATGVAAVSALVSAEDVESAARTLYALVAEAKGKMTDDH